MEKGNYVISTSKPTIVSALGAVPKSNSDELRLIHDCSMPKGQGVNSYVLTLDKLHFQTIDDAVNLVTPECYLAKIDLHHAYRSVPIHSANYPVTGLKWTFSGEHPLPSCMTPAFVLGEEISWHFSSSYPECLTQDVSQGLCGNRCLFR